MTARTIAPNALEIAELIGMANAYELLKHNIGAEYLYVPLRPTDKHRLTLIVGFVSGAKARRSIRRAIAARAERSIDGRARRATRKLRKLVADEAKIIRKSGACSGITRQQVKNISIGDTAGKRHK